MQETSESQPGLQQTYAIAGNRNLRALGILERQNNLTRKPRIHLVDPVHIHKRRSVNAQKPAGIESLLEFCDRLIDAVLVPIDHCIGELVLGQKVRHGIEF